ncbi:phage tail protein [uncultured Photobacterium sp.]|uniref:phage tail protein n=1 Tax=uncultured Photobacterium sp. TaxID=173973 RepID=UPI002635AB52|nr:tail fiber protein [uncultured Photobacterium sp.]
MSEPFIGQVDLYGFNFVPEYWAQCMGQTIAIGENQALFSLIGTAYGGDGRSTFGLPDLRGKVAVSQGQRPGGDIDWKVGNMIGAETHTLSEADLPAHTHAASFAATPGSTNVTVNATQDTGDNNTPSAGSYLAQSDVPKPGRDKPEYIYKSSPSSSSMVPLGGVVAGPGMVDGKVLINSTGNNQEFNLTQSSLIANYCIALQGLFPSRT